MSIINSICVLGTSTSDSTTPYHVVCKVIEYNAGVVLQRLQPLKSYFSLTTSDFGCTYCIKKNCFINFAIMLWNT